MNKTPSENPTPSSDPQGSEKEADAQRPGGPRYHGAGWERADQEAAHGGEPDESAPRADDKERVGKGQVPGARPDDAKN